MAKKYLSLTEAAEMLRVDPEKLKTMREEGEIRGFADRGNWKFRSEDVDNLVRSRQADSDPDLPIFGSSDSSPAIGAASDATSIGDASDDALASVLGEEDPGDDPTVIRGRDEDLSRSDSDVRLIVDDSVSIADSDPELSIVDGSDSDVTLRPASESDVRLASESGPLSGTGLLAGSVGEIDAIEPGGDSDSDVQLVANSDADISLGQMSSDSDVRLGDSTSEITMPPDSDSDVQLIDVSQEPPSADELSIPTDSNAAFDTLGSDSDVVLPAGTDSTSDVVLPGGDSGVTLDFGDAGDDDEASVLLSDADDSGITLEGGSGLLVSGESGISLESPSDSGISLDLDDEGISLAPSNSGVDLGPVGDSGISLEGDSGIALADDVEFADDDHTSAEMAAFSDDDVPETQFEIPAEDSSEFELDAADATAEFDLDDDDATAEFDLSDSLGDDDTGEFDLDDADLSDVSDFDSLDAASVADIDLLEGDDAFDDESFESEAGATYGAVGAMTRSSAAQQDWGTMPVVCSVISLLVMVLAGLMSFDLLGNIYSWNSSEPWTGMVIEQLSGMFS